MKTINLPLEEYEQLLRDADQASVIRTALDEKKRIVVVSQNTYSERNIMFIHIGDELADFAIREAMDKKAIEDKKNEEERVAGLNCTIAYYEKELKAVRRLNDDLKCRISHLERPWYKFW